MQVVVEQQGTPLTNPVPGVWFTNGPQTTYVPHEPIYKKDEETKKDVLVGHKPGAHYKRLHDEGWMLCNAPDAVQATTTQQDASEVQALRAQLAEQAGMMESQQGIIEAMRAEMAALREKMTQAMPADTKKK